MPDSFTPANIEMMRIAYERAREQLPGVPCEIIANRIMTAASSGEMDLDRLLQAGLGAARLPSKSRTKPARRPGQ